MHDIQKRVFEKALQTIITCGATGVAVVFKDEPPIIHGDVALAPKPTEKKRAPRRTFTSPEIIAQIRGMKVGDVVCLPPPEGISLSDWQSTISGRGCAAHGSGNFSTMRNIKNNCVECMRTA